MQTRTPWITLAVLLLAIVGVGCAQPSPTAAPTAVPPPTEVPQPTEVIISGSASEGGRLYDKWWKEAEIDEPTGDQPQWATQSTNTRSGPDTWRCKECHGWDYKGVDGAYSSGSHRTGIAGIFLGTSLSIYYMLPMIGFKGLIVALFGGLESLSGALVGGLLLGMLEGLTGGYIEPLVGGGFREVSAYGLLLIILLVRPYGLFGLKRIERI